MLFFFLPFLRFSLLYTKVNLYLPSFWLVRVPGLPSKLSKNVDPCRRMQISAAGGGCSLSGQGRTFDPRGPRVARAETRQAEGERERGREREQPRSDSAGARCSEMGQPLGSESRESRAQPPVRVHGVSAVFPVFRWEYAFSCRCPSFCCKTHWCCRIVAFTLFTNTEKMFDVFFYFFYSIFLHDSFCFMTGTAVIRKCL